MLSYNRCAVNCYCVKDFENLGVIVVDWLFIRFPYVFVMTIDKFLPKVMLNCNHVSPVLMILKV